MTFAPLVVQGRLPAIQDAISDPWSADHAELRRMAGEKMVAWSKAAVSLQRDAMTLAFRPLSMNPTQMWSDWTSMIEIACRMPGRSHRPIHRAVVANHRRLSSRRTQQTP